MRIHAGATTALRRIVDLGLVILIVVVLLAVILGKGAPLIGRQSIVIGGGSMEPSIGLGAAILVKPADPASLAEGDVVSMRVGPDQTTYTHRIVAVVDRADGRWIRTKGDANAAPDPTLVPASAVIGRVELVVPYAGYLLALLSLPMGVTFVLGLAATLLAIAWLLESLEPEPRTIRRGVLAPAEPSLPPAPVTPSADDPVRRELLQGEPIAARPALAGPSAGSGGSDRDPGAADREPGASDRDAGRRQAGWAFATPTFNPVPAGPGPRPTVRAQLERSREVRRRRDRWLLGQGRDRALD